MGVGFAHALHTPYWVLRSHGRPAPSRTTAAWCSAYRLFLIRATGLALHDAWLEGVLNYCFPKSLILYAEKRARKRSARAA